MKQLETFVATVEYNSFTKASEELYLTQSSVSSHIKTLEQVLQVRLIQRGARRKFCLTAEGEKVYQEAKKIVGQCRMLQNIEDAGCQNELMIGASTVPGQYLLPVLMAGFTQRHKDCRYFLRKGDSAAIHDFLDSGDIKIGFAGYALDHKKYIYHALTQDRLVLITPNTERYREFQRRKIFGMDLLKEPMILREKTSGTRKTLEKYLEENHIPKEVLQMIACMDNPESIKKSVERGIGVSVISSLAVKDEVQAGKILTFDLAPQGLSRKIYMVYRRDSALSKIETQFAAYVRAESKTIFY